MRSNILFYVPFSKLKCCNLLIYVHSHWSLTINQCIVIYTNAQLRIIKFTMICTYLCAYLAKRFFLIVCASIQEHSLAKYFFIAAYCNSIDKILWHRSVRKHTQYLLDIFHKWVWNYYYLNTRISNFNICIKLILTYLA